MTREGGYRESVIGRAGKSLMLRRSSGSKFCGGAGGDIQAVYLHVGFIRISKKR